MPAVLRRPLLGDGHEHFVHALDGLEQTETAGARLVNQDCVHAGHERPSG